MKISNKLVIFLLLLSPLSAFAALTDNLTAYYKFSNGGLTTDSKGTYTLTNTNSVANTSAGKIGYGADFGNANTNKRLETTNDRGYTGGTFSTNFWVKIQTEPTAGVTYVFDALIHLITPANTNNTTYYIRYTNPGGSQTKLDFYLRGTGGNFTYDTTLGTTNWHMLSMIWNGTNIHGFLDATEVGTVAATGNEVDGTASQSAIGASLPTENRWFSSASVDELGFWDNRVLTQGDIDSLYNGGAGNQLIPDTPPTDDALQAIIGADF